MNREIKQAALGLSLAFAFAAQGARADDVAPPPDVGQDVAAPAAAAAVSQPPVAAQAPAPQPAANAFSAPYQKHGYLELDGNHSSLSNGFGSWNGATVQGAIQTDPKNIWSGVVNEQREFGQTGTQFSAGNTHFFNNDVSTNLNVGAGSNAFFLPRARVEGSASKKFLPNKNLVGTLDAGYNDGRVGIRDRWVQASGQYFVPNKPWNFEFGERYNNSSPGNVGSNQTYLAATWGTYKKQFVTARVNWGTEGYQVGVPTDGTPVTATKFNSHYAGVTWRKWMSKSNGFTATLERYKNPFFTRNGVQFGLFHDFGG